MDWPKIIKDLLEAGMSQRAIGEKVGLPQSTVSDLLNGTTKDTGWKKGDALIQLHQEITGKKVA